MRRSTCSDVAYVCACRNPGPEGALPDGSMFLPGCLPCRADTTRLAYQAAELARKLLAA